METTGVRECSCLSWKRLKSSQIGDAVQQIGIFVKHELVTVIQNRQKPPSCFRPVLHAEPLKPDPLRLISVRTLGLCGARLLRELNQVLPVPEAREFHHDEKVVGSVGLGRLLDLQHRADRLYHSDHADLLKSQQAG